jgi:hypothetical protein
MCGPGGPGPDVRAGRAGPRSPSGSQPPDGVLDDEIDIQLAV